MKDVFAQSAPITIESALRSQAIALSYSKNEKDEIVIEGAFYLLNAFTEE